MNQYYQILFRKYLSNQCTREELDTLLDYLKKEGNSPEVESWLKQIWDQAGEKPKLEKDRIDQAFEQIWAQKGQTESLKDQTFKSIKTGKRWAGIAASFLVLMGLGIGLVWFNSASNKITYSSDYGEKHTITLPDQSQVVLNGNSTLTYPDSWPKGKARKVTLKGEAFFNVKHLASDQQFVVETQEGVKVKVLGTTFNVNTRRSLTKVVLSSGKVQLNLAGLDKDRHNITMEPGDLVTFSQKTKKVTREKVKASKYTSWKENLLVFEEESLKNIGRELEDTYGYKVNFGNDSVANLKFTGTIPRNKEELLLEMWEKAFELKINKNKKVININK